MNNLYGLIGGKLGHSFSPEIHKLIFKKLNIEGTYDLFETREEDLKSKINDLKLAGFRGLNVTIPYKTKIIKYIDCISPEAQKIGAVNTIDFKNNAITGYNTDYYGFGAALKHFHIGAEGENAVILGTGGASRAVFKYLADNNIKNVAFVSRNPAKALGKNKIDCNIISYDDMNNLKNQDIIINCTPCGMYPHVSECPVNKNILEKFSAAVDLIYNPSDTVFLRGAQKLGLKAVNGLYMLVSQAAVSEEIWQNTKIEEKVVQEIYEKVKLLIDSENVKKAR